MTATGIFECYYVPIIMLNTFYELPNLMCTMNICDMNDCYPLKDKTIQAMEIMWKLSYSVIQDLNSWSLT